jgi:hypothetical protein
MKYYIKKYLRDTFASIILIISLAVTFFCSLNVSKYIMAENENESVYKYVHSLGIQISDDVVEKGEVEELVKSLEDIYKLYESEKCNISGYVEVKVADCVEYKPAEVMFYQNEAIPYTLEKGDFTEANDELIVYIGKTLEKYTYKMDGKDYIDIGEQHFRVMGIIKSNSVINYSTKILLSYKNLKANLDTDEVENLLDIYIDMYASSNISEENLEYAEKNIQKRLIDTNYVLCSEADTYEEETFIYISKIFGPKITKISNVLCLVTVAIVLNIWIKHKRKEFAIRKAYGMSTIKIFVNLLFQFAKCFVAAIALGIIFQYVYCFIEGGKFDFTTYFSGDGSIIYVYVVAVLLVLMAFHIEYISKIESKNGLADR